MKLIDPETALRDAKARGLRSAVVVTALPLEMLAVRRHLTPLGTLLGRDGNFLELGEFTAQGTSWLVTVVESGAGTHEAHSAVTNALLTIGEAELGRVVS